MSKYLILPIKFINKEGAEKIAQFRELEIEYNEEDYSYDGEMYINPEQIVCFNEDEDGMVNLTLTDGYNHKIFMEFDKFLKAVND